MSNLRDASGWEDDTSGHRPQRGGFVLAAAATWAMVIFGLGLGGGAVLGVTLLGAVGWVVHAARRRREERASYGIVRSIGDPPPHVVVRHVGSGPQADRIGGFGPSARRAVTE